MNPKTTFLNETEQNNTLLQSIKQLIEQAKSHAASQVNQTLVLTYWHIGQLIKTQVLQDERAEYGQATIYHLSQKLVKEYGNGFSARNLARMAQFYQQFSDANILPTLSAKLSWSHFVELLKISDSLQRDFYISMCRHERWSVRTLRERMDSMLFERTALAKQPEALIRQELAQLSAQSTPSPQLFIKDPYILDFLQIGDTPSEKDLENGILHELERFILEFGSDFAFMARQKRIQIGNNDYYIDLLFYHRTLKRLVLIELKLGEFKPEYKGQVELYLKWLAKNERHPDENAPIAIILCSGKDSDVVELMDLDQEHIHVSEYWLKLPSKAQLQHTLHHAMMQAQLRQDQQAHNEEVGHD